MICIAPKCTNTINTESGPDVEGIKKLLSEAGWTWRKEALSACYCPHHLPVDLFYRGTFFCEEKP